MGIDLLSLLYGPQRQRNNNKIERKNSKWTIIEDFYYLVSAAPRG